MALYDFIGGKLAEVMEEGSQSETVLPYVFSVFEKVSKEGEGAVAACLEELKDVEVKEGALEGFVSEVLEAYGKEEGRKRGRSEESDQREVKKRGRFHNAETSDEEEEGSEAQPQPQQQPQHPPTQVAPLGSIPAPPPPPPPVPTRGSRGGKQPWQQQQQPPIDITHLAASIGLPQQQWGASIPQQQQQQQPPLQQDDNLVRLISQLQSKPAADPTLGIAALLQGFTQPLPTMGQDGQMGHRGDANRRDMVSQLQQMQRKDNEKARQKLTKRLGAILVLCKIQPHLNNEAAIKGHFERFGKINVVLCAVQLNRAYVVFSKVKDCSAARECPEAVLGNRFIMVYPCGTADLEELVKIPLKPFQLAKGVEELAKKEKEMQDAKAALETLQEKVAASPDDEQLAASLTQAEGLFKTCLKNTTSKQPPPPSRPWWATQGRSFDNRPRRLHISNIPPTSTTLKDKDHFAQFGELKFFEAGEESTTVEFSARWQAEKCHASIQASDPECKVDYGKNEG